MLPQSLVGGNVLFNTVLFTGNANPALASAGRVEAGQDDYARVRDAIEEHLQGRTPAKQSEVRLRTKGGDYRWFLDRVATHILAFEDSGEIVFLEGNYGEYEADFRRRTGSAAATGGGAGFGGRCNTSSERAPFVFTESGSPYPRSTS